jgi:hypothetical protein
LTLVKCGNVTFLAPTARVTLHGTVLNIASSESIRSKVNLEDISFFEDAQEAWATFRKELPKDLTESQKKMREKDQKASRAAEKARNAASSGPKPQICSGCQTSFPSKSKLFKHLESSDCGTAE